MKYVIGIDEVGRGPLAGPVTVCAVLCEKKLYTKLGRDWHLPPLGKDSKKLSSIQRQTYFMYLNHIGLPYVVVHLSNKQIDRLGISMCIKIAIKKSLNKLVQGMPLDRRADYAVLLDGGLRAPSEFKSQKTIIKGDEKERIIAWASILAKVSRDRIMTRLHKKYPTYGFGIHKGYGTRMHRQMIAKHGLSAVHRISFCKNCVRS